MSVSSADIATLAEGYTAAWCSRSGEAVASFFTADATSTINGAEPTTGRRTIAEDMGAFFVEFPDLMLYKDDFRCGGNKAIYLLTLEGTHSETGKFVRIPGWQNWLVSDEQLIARADGGFDAEEYARQIAQGL
jgi:uncharacterized protein (TIGR02246 family)